MYRSKSIQHWLQNTATTNAAQSSIQCRGMYTAHTSDSSLFTCIQLKKNKIKTISEWDIISTQHKTKTKTVNN